DARVGVMSDPTPPPADPSHPRATPERRTADAFRWQALFQRSSDAVFVLDRQRRPRFVNRAWESLTGLSAADAPPLYCKRPQPAGAGDTMLEAVARALAPPPEVSHGETCRARRRLPGGDRLGPRCWDVEFMPLRVDGKAGGILGRVL